jgi:hypothetical protein
MANYTKLFNSIVTSTIWMEDDQTRIVWLTMLAMADKNGEVQASIPGLANIARVPIESCRIAIGKFLSSDPDSRTKDDEGRRIEEIDGGWLLINHQKYREMASKDELREAETKRKARYRDRLRRNGKSQNVRDMSQDVPKIQHIAEADTDAEVQGIVGEGADRPVRHKSKPPPKAKAESSPEHHEFIRRWTDRFQAVHGRPYVFQGGKDGKAVKTLLASSGLKPDELMAIAEKAWGSTGRDFFHCQAAVTISGFASRINEIQDELSGRKLRSQNNGKTNARPHSYGPDRDKHTYAARRVENKP